jgi:hypothetical protein
MKIDTLDAHTAGEPLRIITGGGLFACFYLVSRLKVMMTVKRTGLGMPLTRYGS